MRKLCYLVVALPLMLIWREPLRAGASDNTPKIVFHTSDRCLACHNGLTTPQGKDVSIGFDWRASIMANSSRDPYWQASVRRETIDHPESKATIEDECSVCHMPIAALRSQAARHAGRDLLASCPSATPTKEGRGQRAAEDGVTCSVCHQIGKEKLGTQRQFQRRFRRRPTADRKTTIRSTGLRRSSAGTALIMQSSTGGSARRSGDHIGRVRAVRHVPHAVHQGAAARAARRSATLPEQMPYQEWLHSDYPASRAASRVTCPRCKEPRPSRLCWASTARGVRQHVFVGGNFFMQRMLNNYRNELSVAALAARVDGRRGWHGRVPAITGRPSQHRERQHRFRQAECRGRGEKPHRTQAADGVSLPTRVAALGRTRSRRQGGVRVRRAQSRRLHPGQ